MDSCLQLSLRIMAAKVKGEGCSNLLISPLSLSTALAMLGAGCSESPALDGLLKFMACKSPEELMSRASKSMSVIADGTAGEDCPIISFVNGAWIDKTYSFQPEYELLLRDTFKSEATKVVDFVNQAREAAREINSWAELHTKGIVKTVITPQQIKDYVVEVVLGNALYFKGKWSVPFNSDWTQKGDFYLLDGDKTSEATFMTKYATYGMFRKFDDFKVFELPYTCEFKAKTSFSMQFILPHKKDGLKSLLEKLNTDPGFLNGGQFKLKSTKMDTVMIPKFEFSDSLEELEFPFMGKGVELSEMLQNVEGVRFGIIILQKAWIKVDEHGSEAAAVTLCLSGGGGGPPPPKKEFVADHPFLFTIKENHSGLVLFVGAVLDPPPASDTLKRDHPSS